MSDPITLKDNECDDLILGEDEFVIVTDGDGVADNVTVNAGGHLCIGQGATVNNIVVKYGGLLEIEDGAFLTGRMIFDADASITCFPGSRIYFDLTGVTPGETALVNDISLLGYGPSFSFVVPESQPCGAYQIAGGATDFMASFLVEKTWGDSFSCFSPGQILDGDGAYMLKLETVEDELHLIVGAPDTTAPVFSGITADIIGKTFRSVTLTAEFEDDWKVSSIYYRIGEDDKWSWYGKGVTVDENTTVYFKSVDPAGNESEVASCTVDNILTHSPKKTTYVYLDFDGESATYDNAALDLSFSVTVQDSGFSEEQKQEILAALTEKFEADNVVFLLERPEEAAADKEATEIEGDAAEGNVSESESEATSVGYSTLYFGKTDAFDVFGSFYGVAETHDGNNMSDSDEAFILLDSSYSTAQAISVAAQNLDHLLGNSYLRSTTALSDYAVKTYMLSTEWDQRHPYNKFCPTDPSTKKQCVVGCTNTAAAQLLYYWIENGMLDLTLSLDDSDSYTKNNITINTDDGHASRAGYLAFSRANEIFAACDIADSDLIPALCFAAGVVQRAEYGSDATSTAWKSSVFTRSGLDGGAKVYYYINGANWPRGSNCFKDGYHGLTDEGVAILVNELLNGRPVGASIHFGEGRSKGEAGHAIVIDGYNSATNEFHVNFGWGGKGNKWYSLEDLNEEYGTDDLVVGIAPVLSSDLTVSVVSTDADIYNLGDEIALNYSIFNQGTAKSEECIAYVYCGESLLASQLVDFVSPGFFRDFTTTIDSSLLTPGANEITVKVDTGADLTEMIPLSKTVRIYDGGITDADDTWQQARDAGEWTGTTLEYAADGIVAETTLAGTEYVGSRDLIDFREITLEHAGLYTFTLSGVENNLEFKLYSLTAKGKLSEQKTRVISGLNGGGALADVPLVRGTYYVSVSALALDEETYGDSSYTLTVAGKGFLQAGNLDDWTDVKTKGSEGELESAGTVTAETTSVVMDEWVGLGDEIDYRMFLILNPAKLSFIVTATDAVKFTVYALQEKTDRKGVTTYGLKSLQSTSVKAGKTVETDALLLPAGAETNRYFFSVQSANAAKGGNADYSVSFNQAGSVFFTAGDNSDDWSDLKTNGADGAVGDAGTVDRDTGTVLSGWVGFGDEFDYAKITLDTAAKLVFLLESTDAAKFLVCGLVRKKDKNGSIVYSLNQLQKSTLKLTKKAASAASDTKGLLLEAGEYYIAMQSTNAAKGGSAEYSVRFNPNSSIFFADADDGWNNTVYALDDAGNAVTTRLNPELADDAFVLGRGAADITLDADATSLDGFSNWVGFGDAADYRMITLEHDVCLTLNLTATGKAKLTIWQVATSAKNGKITLTGKASATASPGKDGAIRAKTLAAGDYFISVASADAANGGGAFCNVSMSDRTVFFDSADDGANDVLYNKKAKAFYAEDDSRHFVTTSVSAGEWDVRLDSNAMGDAAYENFVGYKDKVDCAKIELTTAGNLRFTIAATGNATFTVYRKGTNKKGNETLETIQTTKIAPVGNGEAVPTTTDALAGLDAGVYFISMTAKSTKANEKGSVFYNVTATLAPSAADALAMPDVSAAMNLPDDLCFGQVGADELADVSAASFASRNDKSTWLNVANLA